MRNFILVLVLGFFAISLSAQCDSRKLYYVLEDYLGQDFTSYTQFDQAADSIGIVLGIEHDGSAPTNLRIIKALCNRIETSQNIEIPVTYREGRSFNTAFVVSSTGDTVARYIHTGPVLVLSVDSISLDIDIENPSLLESKEEQACEVCDFSGSVEDIWGRYMSLAPSRMVDSLGIKWSSLDRFTRQHLAQCRYELGRICRPYHALKPNYREANEFVGTTYNPKPVKTSNSLAKAKAKRFWRSVGLWFRSFGACRRASRH